MIKVTLTDGATHELRKFAIADQVAFERHFSTSVAVLQDNPRVEYVAFLAHQGLRRTGVDVPATFDEFLTVLDDVDFNGGEDDAGPSSEATAPTA
jgi:hypothetical protein